MDGRMYGLLLKEVMEKMDRCDGDIHIYQSKAVRNRSKAAPQTTGHERANPLTHVLNTSLGEGA